jgi:hypothetical protein
MYLNFYWKVHFGDIGGEGMLAITPSSVRNNANVQKHRNLKKKHVKIVYIINVIPVTF